MSSARGNVHAFGAAVGTPSPWSTAGNRLAPNADLLFDVIPIPEPSRALLLALGSVL